MSSLARKLILVLTFVLAITVVVPATASATDDKGSPNDGVGPCTAQQVEGGYEPSFDGETCVLTGWNWNFSGTCPGAFDAENGRWGEYQCGQCIICSGGGNGPHPGGGDGPPPCMSFDECFTDEEGGRFTKDINDFISDCGRLGGEVLVMTDDDQTVWAVICVVTPDHHYDCWVVAEPGPLSCSHWDPEGGGPTSVPAPDPVLHAEPTGSGRLSTTDGGSPHVAIRAAAILTRALRLN